MDTKLIINEIYGATISDINEFHRKSKVIIDALNAKQDAINNFYKSAISIGDEVQFNSKGTEYTGTITKLNKKRATIDVPMPSGNIPNQLWNVPFTQLTKI